MALFEEIFRVVYFCLSLFTVDKSNENNNSETTRKSGHLITFPTEKVTAIGNKNHRSNMSSDIQSSESDALLCSMSNIRASSRSPNMINIYSSISRPFLCALWINFGILAVIIPLWIFVTLAVYLDLNTTDLCVPQLGLRHYNPNHIEHWRLMGDCIQTVIIFLWFPFILSIFLGWKKYKESYAATFYHGVVVASIVDFYKIILYFCDLYETKQYFAYPGYVMFFIQLLYSSYYLARNVVTLPRYSHFSKLAIMATVSGQFILGHVLLIVYRSVVVNDYISATHGIGRALWALFAPLSVMIPIVILKHLAMRYSSFANYQRYFILVYVMQGIPILLYRLMQADLQNIWLYIGLSVVRGVLMVIEKASIHLREKLWAKIFISCCRRQYEPIAYSNSIKKYKRFNADLCIQRMLVEYTALILSQIYIVLYLLMNSKAPVSVWFTLKHALTRIGIGVAVDFFFNLLSIFIQNHYYGIPISNVWSNHYMLHFLCNFVATALAIWCLGPYILLIVEVRGHFGNLTNCSEPFKHFS